MALALFGGLLLELGELDGEPERTKCATTEPLQVAAEARAFLAQKGVDLSGEQQTKTKTALEFFANELSAGRSG